MDWKESERMKNIEKQNDAYKDNKGVWRWKSNNRIPFLDILQCWSLSDAEIELCLKTKDREDSESIAEYKKAMENYVPSEEEMFEMKAAFGEGTEIVNVFTGQRFKV